MIKFNKPQDTKAFILGILASLSAVIIWDIIKDKNKLFNRKDTK
tara:strand:- start:171 stop:302 length:132 start_codon:yes stop_codon:yes gene_type:complete